MFIRSYVEVAGPFAEVEAALLAAPGRWLTTAAEGAEAWGATLLSRVGFGPKTGVRRMVELEVGRPVRSPGKAILPIKWHAAHASRLFPVMEADLELTALGPDVSQLALDGRYEPPLGVAGKIADRAFMHRIAEATVRDFVKRIAARLSTVSHPAALG